MPSRRRTKRPVTVIQPDIPGPLCIIRARGDVSQAGGKPIAVNDRGIVLVQEGLTDEQKRKFMPPPKIKDIGAWKRAMRKHRFPRLVNDATL